LRQDLAERAARLRIPLSAQIELTRDCNLRCLHCYVPSEARAPEEQELHLDRILALIRELADAGCMSVALTGGEVTLRDGWLDVVEAIRERRMIANILTNGTVLSRDDVRELAGLRVRQVSISIYGDTAQLHDAITRVSGSFQQAVSSIRALRRAGVSVRVASVLMRQNVHAFDGVRRLAERLDCSYRFDVTVRPGSDGDMRPLEHRAPADDLYSFFADPIVGPKTAEGMLARARATVGGLNACAGGFSAVFVDAYGDVYPCPGFLPGFGSLCRESFMSVWQGDAAHQYRHAMSQPVQECLDCDQRRYCLSRCARLAAIEDGSISGASRRACELASLVKRLCDESDTCPTKGMSVLTATRPA
jgi:radical SAM protein with 4Fe4S-binding SPASM domain